MYTHYAGIDLHKRSSAWVIINTHREVVWEQKVDCDPRAVAFALSICPVPLKQIEAVVEPVCGFRWFQKQLCDAGVDTVLGSRPNCFPISGLSNRYAFRIAICSRS